MSLFRCVDCKKKISNKTILCPYCGCPVNDEVVSNIENQLEFKREKEKELKELEVQIKLEKEKLRKLKKTRGNLKRQIGKQITKNLFHQSLKFVVSRSIIGIILLLTGFVLLWLNDYQLNICRTKGSVVGIDEYKLDEEIIYSYLRVRYFVDGEVYYVYIYDYPKNTYKIGYEITLYYNLFSPENAGTEMNFSIGYLIVITGIIILCCCYVRPIKQKILIKHI